MKWLLKSMTVMQTLLLLPLALSIPGDAARTSGNPEEASWAESISVGTPLAFQQFISQYPDSDKVDRAFDKIIEFQVASAKSQAWDGGLGVQLAQAQDLDLPPPDALTEIDPY